MWLQNAKSRGVTNATSKDYQLPFDRLCICIRAVNGFALSVDGAALLEDRSFAPSSTDRATIDQWQKCREHNSEFVKLQMCVLSEAQCDHLLTQVSPVQQPVCADESLLIAQRDRSMVAPTNDRPTEQRDIPIAVISRQRVTRMWITNTVIHVHLKILKGCWEHWK